MIRTTFLTSLWFGRHEKKLFHEEPAGTKEGLHMSPRPRLPSRRTFRCTKSRRVFRCNKPPSPSAAACWWISLSTGSSPGFPRVASTTSSSVSPAKGYQVPLILNWGVKVFFCEFCFVETCICVLKSILPPRQQQPAAEPQVDETLHWLGIEQLLFDTCKRWVLHLKPETNFCHLRPTSQIHFTCLQSCHL